MTAPSQTDRLFALSRLKQSGAYLTTTEGVILQLVQDARHPSFKEVWTPLPWRPFLMSVKQRWYHSDTH